MNKVLHSAAIGALARMAMGSRFSHLFRVAESQVRIKGSRVELLLEQALDRQRDDVAIIRKAIDESLK